MEKDVDLTAEQRCREKFIEKLDFNLKKDKVCRIDVGKNAFELILSILQDLIPNKNNFELSVYDYCDKAPTFNLRNKVITYNKLHSFKDIINARNVTLRISNTRIIIDLGEAIGFPNMFVSLNKQFSKWVSSRIEPCSFARMLKDNSNYFLIFKNKNLAIFFKEFCKEHNIRDFNNSEEQLNNFISREHGCLVLGKQNGCVFNMSDHLSSYYYSDKEKEYLIDLTKLFKKIYLSNMKNNKNEKTNSEYSKVDTQDTGLTVEQKCRLRFRDELNHSLQDNYACHINLGKNSFNLMITIFQYLIKNVKECKYYIYDKYSQKVAYNELHSFKDIINAKAPTIFMFRDKRIEINLGSSRVKSVSLNRFVENWFISAIEPHSFARILKEHHNYFINFQDKKLAIFFKKFCQECNINDFDDCQKALDLFINFGFGPFILGKKDGVPFYMPLGIAYNYYSNQDQEYWVDVTHILHKIYLANIGNMTESDTDVVKSEAYMELCESLNDYYKAERDCCVHLGEGIESKNKLIALYNSILHKDMDHILLVLSKMNNGTTEYTSPDVSFDYLIENYPEIGDKSAIVCNNKCLIICDHKEELISRFGKNCADVTNVFNRWYNEHSKSIDKAESFEKNNEIIEKFLSGRGITIQIRDIRDKQKCAKLLNELQEVATFRLEPKKLTIPQYIWDLLNPIYTQILFNHETKNLHCYTDNFQLIFDLEDNSWSYELKNCNDVNSPCIIPLEALREKIDVEDLEPQFALAIRPSGK